MRKIVAVAFVSLDGVMQGPGAPEEDPSGGFALGGWTVPYFDEEVGAVMTEILARPFDLLLGRRTYDVFAAHWPHVATDEMAAEETGDGDIARRLNDAVKYVATSDPASLGWAESVWLGESVVDTLSALKAGDGPDLLVQGSSVLLETLFLHDLVDEIRLIAFPVVLGDGKRFFAPGAALAFRPLEHRVTPSGVAISRLERAGPVETGSFALEEPTEAELERRSRQHA